ncbi:MFS transporter [Terrarubrum flagellatum]|uniref:MFS transporter n=1 Tax=Terrirubrum flagellatum TaxID=2895980 RepID=UPI0031453B4D
MSASLAAPAPAPASTSPTPPSLLSDGFPPWIAVAIASLSSFMVVMDGAIVNVALPSMRADLGLSAAALQWVVDAYLLALGGAMLLAARAGDLYGRRTILQAGLILFTAASVIGGFASNGAALIAARAAQGLGASALATSTLALVVAVYQNPDRRGRAVSFLIAASAIAAALGVTIGGMLTHALNWRWVMFVNAPVGVILIALVAICLSARRNDGMLPKLDIPGAVAITLALATMTYGVTQAPITGWTSTTTLASLGAAVFFLVVFITIESRAAQPLIRLDIFRLRQVSWGNVMLLCVGAVLTTSIFLIALALQQVAGYDALQAGLAMFPMTIAIAIASIGGRRLGLGGRSPLIGALMAAAGLGWLSFLPLRPDFPTHLLIPTVLIGLGAGLKIATAISAALDGVPQKDAGLASGLLNTSRQIGGALGVAIGATVAHMATSGWNGEPALAELAGYRAAFLATGALSLLAGLASLALPRKSI